MSPKPLLDLKLYGGKKTVLSMLVRGYPNGVAMEDIIERYYSGHTGEAPEKMVRKIVGQLRDIIGEHGWTIPRGTGGRCGPGEYRLEPVEGK